jgi:phage tail sheath gpL-like
MALTSIGDQKTPGRPIEITFAAETGIPSDAQELTIIGHKDAVSGSIAAYEITEISNAGDLTAASAEVASKFGAGSEIARMILAAIRVNLGGSTFPKIKAVPLASGDAGFGSGDAALVTAKRYKAEFLVSPYDANDSTLRTKLKDTAQEMSGAQRVENNQFGTMGVSFNRSVTDPANLPVPDTQFLVCGWLRDTGTGGDAPDYSIGEMAAAMASKMASNGIPFNPLDDETLTQVLAPKKQSDWPTVGAALESETALSKGWTPLYVKANGEVAFVRTVTARISADGSGAPVVTAYYDVQDFQVLYFWRKTLWTRFSQPDFKQRKASNEAAAEIRSEAIRLASLFEDQDMFQAVRDLAKKFQVERKLSDRHRFDVKTPVNVIPGLHVIATNIEATTEFDTISI